MKPLLFSLHAADGLKRNILASGAFEEAAIERRRFPDGEAYVRLDSPVEGRAVILLCSLDRPDERLMALLLAADAARRQGALQVGLIAPYLAYMRQDQAFRSGEAISARSFAAILSRHFDWLVTLEPHLHRIANLGEVFSIPARAARASAPIGDWIASNVERPFLIGPDCESAPWIERIANHVAAPFAVLEKHRLGDHKVRITGTLGGLRQDMTPVVVDDIVSSGATMTEIIEQNTSDAGRPITYIAVHALFREVPEKVSNSKNFDRFVSCNSVQHPSNQIDIAEPLLVEANDLLGRANTRHRL